MHNPPFNTYYSNFNFVIFFTDIEIGILGRSYLLMSPLSLDEFCNWMYNERRIWNKDLLQMNSEIEIKDPSASVDKGMYFCIKIQEGNRVYIFPQQKLK